MIWLKQGIGWQRDWVDTILTVAWHETRHDMKLATNVNGKSNRDSFNQELKETIDRLVIWSKRNRRWLINGLQALLGCCLVSLLFLCDILSTGPVVSAQSLGIKCTNATRDVSFSLLRGQIEERVAVAVVNLECLAKILGASLAVQ